MNLRTNCRLALMAAAILAGTSPASADEILFNVIQPVNGVVPNGTLTAQLVDVAPNTVRMTMNAVGLTDATEYVPVWVFNLIPTWNFGTSPLTFSYISGVQAISTTSGANFTDGGNNMKAGLFDIRFDFETSNSAPPPTSRLRAGNTSVYTIMATGLSVASFLALSVPDGNNPGGYYTAADVRGIGVGAGSGSIASATAVVVPEPSTMALSGLLVVFAAGRLALRSIRSRVAA